MWTAIGLAAALAASAAPAAPSHETHRAAADRLFNEGKPADALGEIKIAIDRARAAHDELEVARSMGAEGGILVGLGRMGEAEAPLKGALDIFLRLRGPDHPDTLAATSEYAGWLVFQGRDQDALPLLEHAVAGLARTASTPDQRAAAAEARGGYAMSLFNLGRWADGEREMKASLAVLNGADRPDRSTPMAFMSVLSDAYYRWGRYQDAMDMAKATLAMREQYQGPEHPELTGTLDNLASIEMALGDEGAAEAHYRRELQVAQKAFPQGGPLVGKALKNLALFYSQTGRGEDALPLFDRAIAAFGADKTYRVGLAYREYAVARLRLGQAREAQPLAEKALAVFQVSPGPASEQAGDAELLLARIAAAQGDVQGAGVHAQNGLDIFRKTLTADNPRQGDALVQLALAAELSGNAGRAGDLYGDAVKAMLKTRPAHHQALIGARAALVRVLLRDGKAPAETFGVARAAADPLRERVLANARLAGRAGTPNLDADQRGVFLSAVESAWAYADALRAAGARETP